MFNLDSLIRKNIQQLKPYSSSRDEYKGKEGIFLDANENPFGQYNRYPDPYQIQLKQKLSELKNIPIENIFIGNGSDEVIDLALRIFCEPAQDSICVFPPTYGMYEVSANINNVYVQKIHLTEDFQLDIPKIQTEILDNSSLKPKIIFICSPNNPTGNSLQNIEFILKNFHGIIVVDEAYIDFSNKESLLQKIREYPNLMVSQTFSKARGLAAARVGICYASKEIISYFNKVKPPYNVSVLNQNIAIETLENTKIFNENVNQILTQKQFLISELEKLNFVTQIFPSDANFILVEMKKAEQIFAQLIAKKIITRNRCHEIPNCLRISIGTAYENKLLVEELQIIKNELP